MKKKQSELPSAIDIRTYSKFALPHLEKILNSNENILKKIASQIVINVLDKKVLFIFGSGHSSLIPLEIYHRAGGPSFVIPLVADYLLPTAGPSVVRLLERMEGSSAILLNRAQPNPGEMIWLVSQSGINPSIIDLAVQARKAQLTTVAFTSVAHSQGVPSRHSSGKKLFELCDEVVDLGGVVGDAAVPLTPSVSAGPLSTLGGIFLAHSILTEVAARLEEKGVRCVYTSVNSPTGEARNRQLEELASIRDPLLR